MKKKNRRSPALLELQRGGARLTSALPLEEILDPLLVPNPYVSNENHSFVWNAVVRFGVNPRFPTHCRKSSHSWAQQLSREVPLWWPCRRIVYLSGSRWPIPGFLTTLRPSQLPADRCWKSTQKVYGEERSDGGRSPFMTRFRLVVLCVTGNLYAPI